MPVGESAVDPLLGARFGLRGVLAVFGGSEDRTDSGAPIGTVSVGTTGVNVDVGSIGVNVVVGSGVGVSDRWLSPPQPGSNSINVSTTKSIGMDCCFISISLGFLAFRHMPVIKNLYAISAEEIITLVAKRFGISKGSVYNILEVTGGRLSGQL